MEQTAEKWETWQQEIENKVDCLKEGTRKRTLLYSGLLKVIMRAFTVSSGFESCVGSWPD
jgi:hypothetical protein